MMSRRNPKYAFLAAVALLAWLTAGSYFVSENCCSESGVVAAESEDAVVKVPMLVNDGDKFSVSSNQSIVFTLNDSKPVLYEDVSINLMKIIEYVKSNPLKLITLTGLYSKDETKGLVVARNRADSIRNILRNSGVPDYQIKVHAAQDDHLIRDNKYQLIYGAVTFSFDCLAPFEVQDASTNLQLATNNNFIFKFNEAALLFEPDSILIKQLRGITQHLQKNKNRKLLLTGYCHPDEQYQLMLNNLGYARANTIRSLLMKEGADGIQIEIMGREDARIAVVNNTIFGQLLPNPMGYAFQSFSKKERSQLLSKKRAIERTLKEIQVFRFKNLKNDAFEVDFDARTKAYIDDLVFYLSVNSNAKVYCVGHSNKSSSDSLDYAIGSNRAVYILKFLSGHGIPMGRMEIRSAGSTHPLGEKTTQYGQAINRRVDLFISFDGKMPKLYALPPKVTTKRTSKRKPQKVSRTTITSSKSSSKTDTSKLPANTSEKTVVSADSFRKSKDSLPGILSITPLDSSEQDTIRQF